MVSLVESRDMFNVTQKLVSVGFHLLLGKIKLMEKPRPRGTLVVFLYLTLPGSYDVFYVSLLVLEYFYMPLLKILTICA